MFIGTTPGTAIVFLALAIVFVGLAVRDYLLQEGKLSPARKTWLRMSLIFSAVAVGLFIWHTFIV